MIVTRERDLFQAYPNKESNLGRLMVEYEYLCTTVLVITIRDNTKSVTSFFEGRFGDKAFGEGECHRPKN